MENTNVMVKPTNRFFYSKQQANLFGYDDANKVFNGKEWLEYSEWISKDFMDETCNWEDAVLVFETEEDWPPIEVNPNKHLHDDYMTFEE